MANSVSAVAHRTTLWFEATGIGHFKVGPSDHGLGWYVMRGDDYAPAIAIATGEQEEQREADNAFHGSEA